MPRATIEDWSRYYEGARRRRRAIGGDPLARYLDRRDALEKRMFIAGALLLLALLAASYAILVR